MFKLEQAIAEWRRRMAADGLKASATLDELESHLQEDVERQVQSGIGAEQSFYLAVGRLGQSGALTHEFAKVGEASETFSRIKYFFFTLAGIQNATLATNMNTSYPQTNLEPRWATYLKSAGFVLPAITLWMAMVVFVVPKLREVCAHAGFALPNVYNFVFFLMQHGFVVCGALIAGLMFLEWRSDRWPRYRRAAFGVGVFILNAAVLMLISSMVVYAVVAAATFTQPVK